MTVKTDAAPAAAPTESELAQARTWAEEHLAPAVEAVASGRLPFSFTYGGKPSAILLAESPRSDEVAALDAARTQRTITWIDPGSGLQVRCIAVEYRDFPVVEWSVYLRNTGTRSTPILEDLQGLDLHLERDPDGEYVLHCIKGDSCTPDSYEPFDLVLGPGSRQRFASTGGRPTNGAYPCTNLELPGGGIILAVGWPGQWESTYTRDADRGLAVRAGQEQTHLTLRPGEEVRTPLNVVLRWEGTDLVRAQNLWRRWMLTHNTPHPGGKPPGPIFCFCDGAFFTGLKCNATDEMKALDTLHRQGIELDYWWMDAGWYPGQDWAQGVGTWEPDPERFPHGIRQVADHAHSLGAGLVLWFEPERVMPGTWLAQTHPEWLLGSREGTMLLNLGDPAARAWLTEHVDRMIGEQGITLYRQDFNMDPLPYWRDNDAPDRQGMTENLHVQGYLAYWDELRRRHPDMLIDSCASGGRRNDLETLRRAVPLLRSD
ncbi:MAG: glycoside hydrolase family 36 protein, partial [Candidatus Latescibacterota bacterium]